MKRRHTFISSLLVIGLTAASQSLWAQQDQTNQDLAAAENTVLQHSDEGQGSGRGMNRQGGGGMRQGEEGAANGGMAGEMQGGMMQERMQQMHAGMHSSDSNSGQSAFDLISQVVDQLEANPDTDWQQVNVDALRQHLVDMDEVTMNAEVTSSQVDGGARYVVTGQGRTVDAIKRMVPTHAAQIETELGWITDTELQQDGVVLLVRSDDPATTTKLRGLGFSGFMVAGEHHADHHIMIAGGQPQTHEGMDHQGMNQGQGNGSGHGGQGQNSGNTDHDGHQQ